MFPKLILPIILLSAASCNALALVNIQQNSCDDALYKRDMLVICEKVTSTRLGEVKQHVEWESHMPASLLRCLGSSSIEDICASLGIEATTTFSDYPDIHTFVGVDAVAKDAQGRTVGSRTIHSGTACEDFTGTATQFDILQVPAGYGLRVWSHAGCVGLGNKYTKKGTYHTTGRLSWSVESPL
ncbi:hypothetical protein L218DRAFT_949288 [Marasmius fiardii PR-910]|nr:hypothetical protein L218DRAFT_949288 [Marasmius fiardii PR-910]